MTVKTLMEAIEKVDNIPNAYQCLKAEDEDAIWEVVDAFKEIIENIRWRDCAKELPEDNELVLTISKHYHLRINWIVENGHWYYENRDVIRWMRYPQGLMEE